MFSDEKREKRTVLIASKITESDRKKLGFLFQKYKLYTPDATLSNCLRRLILKVYAEKRKT